MPYTEGAHDSPADTKDRLLRVGTKYQSSAPSVADGDNVYFLVDSAGRLLIAGAVAHDAVYAGNPLGMGLNAQSDTTSPTDVAVGDLVRQTGTLKGAAFAAQGSRVTGDGLTSNVVYAIAEDDIPGMAASAPYIMAGPDRAKSAGDSGSPGRRPG